ncbi:unnamed protein product [Triticum turgidum subsp. durum]|uniref:Pentacotripeptide-repeat region of PRORP domain-containing protein n=1 Tax=Triticum turgidum subsp. durum TaxID=4567 RepID=A0A9R1BBQ3_TRITD|nr:unnamed protein product [Triticum turgidum subsp. durum]
MPFNALLSAFVRCRRHRRVPVLFEELSKEFSITPNATSYAILVKAHCMVRHDAKAHEVIARMREEGISPTTTIYTTMIDSMYKQKKVEEAQTLWKQMLESGCKPDHATYNVKAMHHGLNGKPEGVLQVMAEMEADGVKPDTITYNFLMTAYCKDGKMEDAKALYHSLGDKGCSANAATYKHMLAALEAKEVIYVVTKKFPDTMLSGWKKLEKELGFCSDSGDTTPHAECTAEEPVSESEPATTEALELKDSAAEETGVSEEYDGDEMPSPETSTDEEVPRGPA